jgi:hypothetical protein
MSKRALHQRQSPWPGPRPYEIREGNFFFGRDREIEELRRMILRERLTVLSADSGSGKTSLLRAGLIFRLAKQRQKDKERIKPILLFENWGGGKKGGGDAEQLFTIGLEDAIKALNDNSKRDYKVLSKITSGATFFENIRDLCDAEGGVILIFDQFEEILRVGETTARRALEIIIDIYRYEPRARVVISLRSEFHKDLRSLEAYVGGLYTRTYFLKTMGSFSVQEALSKSAGKAGICFIDDVDKKIVEMLVNASREHTNVIGGYEIKGKEEKEETANDHAVNLLTLQAILPELFDETLKKERPDGGAIIIDNNAFKTYIAGRESSALIRDALSNWIEKALNKPVSPRRHLTSSIAKLPKEELTGIVHRIASRMALFLSSGGYKTSAEEVELLYNTLQNDLSRLTPEKIQLAKLKIVENKLVSVDGKELSLGQEFSPKEEQGLSGISIKKKWDPAKTANNLVGAFFETLYRLHNANILKSIHIGKGQVWELVHDGMGRPFSDWSDEKKDTWDDAVHSLTTLRGIDIFIPEKLLLEHSQEKQPLNGQKAEKVSWQGCYVSPGGNRVLRDYEFLDCDLKGTVFANCIFQGGRFSGCILSGSLFLNCRFEPNSDGEPVRFENCQANAMTFLTPLGVARERGSYMSALEFRNCDLTQVKFAGIVLAGEVVFSIGTRLAMCHFSRLQEDLGHPGKMVFKDCNVYYTACDKQSRRLINDIDAQNVIGFGMLEDE